VQVDPGLEFITLPLVTALEATGCYIPHGTQIAFHKSIYRIGEDMAQPKVLFIVDDAHVLTDIAATLANEGYSVFNAANLEQVLEILSKNHFPVVFIDLNLLVLDGMSLCSWIRRFNKESRIIALCGQNCNPSKCRASGFDEVLRRPFSAGEVIQAIKHANEKSCFSHPPLGKSDCLHLT
jgi:CheY-like chemotaxis protein